MFLHAHTLALHHPITGRPIALEAPMPEAYAAFMRAAGSDAAEAVSRLERARVSSGHATTA
jgi:hypothetical protein